jgi:hypothetical protein
MKPGGQAAVGRSPDRAAARAGATDTPAGEGARLDLVGAVLSGLVVYGILRSGTWGLVLPKAGAPAWLGLSPVIWLILSGGVVLRVFLGWEDHRLAPGGAAGVRLLPLSITLLLAAAGVPRVFRTPHRAVLISALTAMFIGRRILAQQPSAAPAREPLTLRRGA